MIQGKSWCTKKYLKKVKSIDMTIRRKSIEPIRRTKSVKTNEIPLTPKRIATPKRQVRILSPNGRIEIKGSPEAKKYASVRRIDFSS